MILLLAHRQFFCLSLFLSFWLLAREIIVFGQLGYGKNLPMFRAGSYTGLVLLKQLCMFTSVSVKVGDMNNPQPNISGYYATTDGEERLETTDQAGSSTTVFIGERKFVT